LKDLAAVEIKEYQGTDLSSIADFRENSIKGPQQIDLESYRLKVDGLVENPLEYTLEEAIGDHQSSQKVVTLSCVEGWRVKILWEGVLVKDLIAEAKALPEANTVIFHAHDGYTTSLPLDYITGQDIMLAYKMNGVVLPPERGAPFQLRRRRGLGDQVGHRDRAGRRQIPGTGRAAAIPMTRICRLADQVLSSASKSRAAEFMQ
jgi:DMSO/TMAO reductase YedYZ molybdopterin-dependent catalytic subunit